MLWRRSAGKVSTRATGRATRGLSIATPMNTSAAATPTVIAAFEPPPIQADGEDRDAEER